MGHRAPATRKAMKLHGLEVLVWRAIRAEESDRNTTKRTIEESSARKQIYFDAEVRMEETLRRTKWAPRIQSRARL